VGQLDPESWVLVEVALNTGLRRGEQFALRWEHVDFTTGVLTVPRSKHGEARRLPMTTRCGASSGPCQPPQRPVGLSQRDGRNAARPKNVMAAFSCRRSTGLGSRISTGTTSGTRSQAAW